MNVIDAMRNFVFLMVIGSCTTLHADNWEYVNPLDPGSSFVLIDDPANYVAIDVARPAIVCQHTSNYICFESNEFSLHLPRNFYDSDPDNWIYENHRYESKQDPYLEVLGRPRDSLRLVTKIEPDATYRYII